MIYPTVHLNGTSKERLLEAMREAHEALWLAICALKETYPHGRDYYPQGNDVWAKAADEWQSRNDHLNSVYSELLGLTTFLTFGHGEEEL
jgi:hypothetical protein